MHARMCAIVRNEPFFTSLSKHTTQLSCPSCGVRRMAESAALVVDKLLPEQPMRQQVLSFPFPLRFLFASRPAVME